MRLPILSFNAKRGWLHLCSENENDLYRNAPLVFSKVFQSIPVFLETWLEDEVIIKDIQWF